MGLRRLAAGFIAFRRWLGVPLTQLFLITGCGGNETSPTPPPDSGSPCPPGEMTLEDGSCLAAGVPPDACAEGFVADGLGGCTAVLPADLCDPGLMAVPGETTCRPIADCGSGPWGNLPVDGQTQYVDGAYQGSSDGTAEHPWTTIQSAIDAAPPGGMVAVAAGQYVEGVVIEEKPVALWGRCPDLVQLSYLADSTALRFAGSAVSGSSVHQLAVAGLGYGVTVHGAEDVVLERLWIHHANRSGLVLVGDDGPITATLRSSLLSHNGRSAVIADGPQTTLAIEQSVVREGIATGALQDGVGVSSQRGAHVSLTRCLVEHNYWVGIQGNGGHLTVVDSVSRFTHPLSSGEGGIGILAFHDAGTSPAVSVIGSELAGNTRSGIAVEGGTLLMELTTVRDTAPEGTDEGIGSGVDLVEDYGDGVPSSGTIRQSHIRGSHVMGIYVANSEVAIELTEIHDTYGGGLGFRAGRGLQLQNERPELSTSTVHALALRHNQEVGIMVAGHVQVEITDTLIEDTPAWDGVLGDGLVVVWQPAGAATATVKHCRVANSARAAVHTHGGTIALQDSSMECSPIYLNSQDAESFTGALNDNGGNRCGCGPELGECQVMSTEIEPPGPLGP